MSNIFNKISFYSLFFTIVLLPIFFLPFTKIPIETSKGALFVFGLFLCVVFWSMARFSDGKIFFPKSYLLLSLFSVVLSFFLSSLFSGSMVISFFGIMFDIGTFWSIFSVFILTFFSSIFFKDKKDARLVLFGLLTSFSLLFIFQIFRFIMPNTLSFGILGNNTGNLFGSWNSFGIISAFSVLICLLLVEFFEIKKETKYFLVFLFILSTIMSIFVGYSLVWIVLGVFAFIIFAYKIYISFNFKEEGKNINFPILPFVIIIFSLLFTLSGQFINGAISKKMNFQNLEVNPTFSSTLDISKNVLKHDPIFGIGLNKFTDAWSLYKPIDINYTRFWDASFNSSFGLLPTFVSTSGILGSLALVLFIFLFLFFGIKDILFFLKRKENNFEIFSFFILSLFLIIVSIFYSVGIGLFFLLFVFLGIFIGLSSNLDPKKEVEFSFLDDPRKSFFAIVCLLFIMLSSIVLSFKYGQKFASLPYFSKALASQDIDISVNSIEKALSLHQNDLYFRTASEIYFLKLNSIYQKGNDLKEEDKSLLQIYFDKSVNSASLAVNYDKQNYLNYKVLAATYFTASKLGLADAYIKAEEFYNKAITLNPLNPSLKLALANIAFEKKDFKNARLFGEQALSLQSNYVDAIIFLSQLEKISGDNAKALFYAEGALRFYPNDKDLLNYINSLKVSNKIEIPIESTKEKVEVKKEQSKKK